MNFKLFHLSFGKLFGYFEKIAATFIYKYQVYNYNSNFMGLWGFGVLGVARDDQLQSLRLHDDAALGHGDAGGDVLLRHIHHARLARGGNMGEAAQGWLGPCRRSWVALVTSA